MTNIEENTNNLGEVCACDFLWDVFCAGHSMATTRSHVARHVPATPLQMSVAGPISCHGCSQASSCHKNGTDRRAGVWLPAWQSASHCRVLCVCCGVACLLWLVLARCLFFFLGLFFFFWVYLYGPSYACEMRYSGGRDEQTNSLRNVVICFLLGYYFHLHFAGIS